MSIYRPKGSPFFHFDFQLNRRRFHGSTGRTKRREAEAVERTEREKAKAIIRQSSAGVDEMTVDIAVGRYWTEVGQHHVRSGETWRDLARLVAFLGPQKRLAEIDDAEMTRIVAWRRGHRAGARKDSPLVSPATVNRSTTQRLQAIFTQARRNWRLRFDAEPHWRRHRLAEPIERVRELRGDEAVRLDEAMREDYAPFFDFARATGQRLQECLLRWSEVDWQAGQISKTGKGGRLIVVPITSAVRKILWPLRGHHPEHVFTYVARRTRAKRVKGQRYPLTYSGVKSAWKAIRRVASVENFRFHDFRHDLATKLLRETGNLKLVQRALNHADLKTTIRYAHVANDEVAEALERVQKSRNKPRKAARKTG